MRNSKCIPNVTGGTGHCDANRIFFHQGSSSGISVFWFSVKDVLIDHRRNRRLCGYRRAPNLATQAKILSVFSLLAKCVNRRGTFTRVLSGFNIFKSFDGRHLSPHTGRLETVKRIIGQSLAQLVHDHIGRIFWTNASSTSPPACGSAQLQHHRWCVQCNRRHRTARAP